MLHPRDLVDALLCALTLWGPSLALNAKMVAGFLPDRTAAVCRGNYAHFVHMLLGKAKYIYYVHYFWA